MTDEAEVLEKLLAKLRLEDQSVIDELTALSSILGGLQTFSPSRPPSLFADQKSENRYIAVSTTLLNDDVPLELLITLPASYPRAPPVIQVKNVFLGAFATDYVLFGEVLRIYLHEGAWSEGEAVLFDGIERAREVASDWYAAKVAEKPAAPPPAQVTSRSPSPEPAVSAPDVLPDIELAMSEPIVDRKSVFVGWAAKLSSPHDVPGVLSVIKSDKKVAKATHNIFAWRCRTEGVLHQDNDDDGETAAGARLAHLLDILKVENAIVVVSRWYGGVHLGADRFKHVNAAARAALEAGGFIPDDKRTKANPRKH